MNGWNVEPSSVGLEASSSLPGVSLSELASSPLLLGVSSLSGPEVGDVGGDGCRGVKWDCGKGCVKQT